jgi:glyoxylase-like metal-dependent hydrolase (beta-lactamase superfamily II)
MLATTAAISRRRFLAHGSCFGAFYAFASAIPLPALSRALSDDPRVAQAPLVDAGFASVRSVGNGLYATISDTSKGYTTISNGGFLVGKDAALLVEGYASAQGAAFQMDALRKVSQVPAAGALDTHYHFDHSFGNSFYGANGIPLWAHADVPKRIFESYVPLQGADRAKALGALEQSVQDAKTDVQKQHAQSDLAALSAIFDLANKTPQTLPNRGLDPVKLPLNVDLGGLAVIIEPYPGHSGTDLILRVPDQNVVYSGDLLFSHMYPVCIDAKATVSGWRATLKTFSSWDKKTIFVPGHGQVCGQEGVQQLIEVFDDIAEQAEKLYKAGVPAPEAAERYVIPEKFKTFGVYSWEFTLGSTVKKLYAEWQGK